jgi:hypothetical protein
VERPRPTEPAARLRPPKIPAEIDRSDPEGISRELREACPLAEVGMNLVWADDGQLTLTAVREFPPIPAACERAGREMLLKRFQIKPPRDAQGQPTAGKAAVKVRLD